MPCDFNDDLILPANDYQRVGIYDSAAKAAYVQRINPILIKLHPISFFVTRIESIINWAIATDADPGVVVQRVACNVFFVHAALGTTIPDAWVLASFTETWSGFCPDTPTYMVCRGANRTGH